jgi:parvulin-like peptidyl-prolyl isomerase
LKKDLAISLAVIAAIFGIVYGISSMRVQVPLRPSKPFQLELTPHAQSSNEKVVMRVNDVPVTEAEFTEAFRQLPEEMQRQYANPAGRQAFAEQYIRYKLLAQEGEKTGVADEPRLKAQLESQRTTLVANATLVKLVKVPDEGAARAYYMAHPQEFSTVELSHILIAYQGGAVPPRQGNPPLTEEQAAAKAASLYQKIRQGADFRAVAAATSDDVESAPRGGDLGPLSKGMLPPEIEAQVFRLPPGQVSGPIASRFGIHLFKVGQQIVQPFERVKNVVAMRLRQQNAFDRVELMRKQAKIDFDPKFFPDAKTWGKSAGAPPS